MANRFYLLTMASGDFEGMVTTDGPHLKVVGGDSLAVGEAYLAHDFPSHPGWWVFDLKGHIALSTLTEKEVGVVAEAFGLPIRTGPTAPIPDSLFWTSPAFRGLCDWVRHHKTRAEHQAQRHHQRPPYWLAMCEAAISVQDDEA
ncbi:hypothetical protein [Ferrimonas balearica]|uniref:hypothetical protein n=1 Tax=Ferrimonas balearica TaxID=44012 RepID=UPI001C999BD3|nr:hypothetical protein [Ferrimonas balearica]MBY5920532.1 hypothetical protein [Ferrimonas balearica]MBY5996783.1 hypothetical protein [Ferrimonas balearica]